eukprot:jgi/Galph1/4361/GphlegSOOS_G2982.1
MQQRRVGLKFSIYGYLKRLLNIRELAFDYAFWQFLNLCFSPSKFYRNTKYHRQTKNQWARDDPAFLLVLLYFILMTSLCYAVCFQLDGFGIVWYVLWNVIFWFFGVGCIVSFLYWKFCNSFLIIPGMKNIGDGFTCLPCFSCEGIDTRVEWLYSTDVHCNGYFLYMIINSIVRYFLLPLILRKGYLAAGFSNILYFCALCSYFYISFLGYDILPFLRNTHYLLYTIPLSFVAVLLLTLFGVDLWLTT